MDKYILLKFHPMDFTNNILAPLIVAVIVAITTWFWTNKLLKNKIDAAPRKYVLELDKLINNAIREGEANAIVNARAIVAARNSLRSSLISISRQLNSEIDRLAQEIGETIDIVPQPSVPNNEFIASDSNRAFQTINVLSRVWPAKKEQIEVEIRKLLAELGLTL